MTDSSVANNPFESGARKVIPAVLVYARMGDQFLMIHRGGEKKGDYHLGKWNGLGGKLEADESPLEGARRELREESGLDLEAGRFRALGALQFPNFKAHKNEDWMVFLFKAEVRRDEVPKVLEGCAEGTLHWIPIQEILNLNLWAGDRLFIPSVLAGRPVIGTIWYEGQSVSRHWIEELGW